MDGDIMNSPVKKMNGDLKVKPEEMTSADYYFDSYAHFGIHEEMLKVFFFSLEHCHADFSYFKHFTLCRMKLELWPTEMPFITISIYSKGKL